MTTVKAPTEAEILAVTALMRIEVGDRVFVPAKDLTFEQDMYLMGIATDAGLGPDVIKQADVSKNAQKVIVSAYRSGKMFLLIAAALVEEGKEDVQWTPAVAEEIAHFLSQTKDKDAKAKLNQVMVGLLLSFTLGVDESLATFQRSSAVSEPAR